MHVVKTDTWTLGVAWLDKQLYGEGGLQIHLGHRIVCFWTRPEELCYYCLGQGEHWPLSEDVWRCPKCDAEYSE